MSCIETYGSAVCMQAALAGLTPEQYLASLAEPAPASAVDNGGEMDGQQCIARYGSAVCMQAALAGMTPEQYLAEVERRQQIEAASAPGATPAQGGYVYSPPAEITQARPVVYALAGAAAGIVLGVAGATIFYLVGKML